MLASFKKTLSKVFIRTLKATEHSSIRMNRVETAPQAASLNHQPSVSSAIAMVNMRKAKSLEEIFPNYKQIDNFKETVKSWSTVAEKDKELWNLRIDDLKINLAHINDKKIIDYINEVLQKEKFCYSDFEDIELLTDSINSFNGMFNYSEDYYNGAIACSTMDNANFKRTLRHELTHTNELRHLSTIKKKYNLYEIMPKKIVNGVQVIDFDNCKYKEELLNAGIEPYRVKYAYNNTSEFIAIASEGNMNKYSKELKQTLIDFGMPEWMFKMNHI